MDAVTLKQAKNYADKLVQGLGALKGANCVIDSIDTIPEGNRVTFSWTGTDGITETSTMIVENGVNGNDGTNGIDGVGVSKIEKINTVSLVDTYRITFTDNTTYDYSVTNGQKGEQGIQGLRGEKGEQGEQGIQGIQGIKGEKGDDGYPFLIYKEYSDVSEFNKNDFPEIGLMFMIVADGASSFPVYRYTGDDTVPYRYVTDLTGGEGIKGEKGDKGEQGEQGVQGENGKDGITYIPTIGTVTSGDIASATVVVDDETSTAEFSFVLPKGDNVTVDAILSNTSENPVQNKVIKQAIDNKADKTVATTETDGLMSAADKTKLDGADNTYALKSKYGDTTINVGRKAGTDVGSYSTAEGNNTTASGYASHAEGSNAYISNGEIAFYDTRAVTISDDVTVEVDSSKAYGANSHAEGCQTLAYGNYSHAEGRQTAASGSSSHAEGYKTTASGAQSHAEGVTTTASGGRSHAEGSETIASGGFCHAEGWRTTANGNNSCHAEGYQTTACGIATHVEGSSNNKATDLIPDLSWSSTITTNDDIINAWNTQKFSLAHGRASHVEGHDNLTLGYASHAEGQDTVAIGDHSHTSGYYTKALHENEAAYGKYNVSNDDTLFSIGDGTADDARHNAFEITTTGGKLHDKDIATTDLIPTSLPANGGNADYATNAGNADKLDGLHADDFAKSVSPRITGDIVFQNDTNQNTINAIYSAADALVLRNITKDGLSVCDLQIGQDGVYIYNATQSLKIGDGGNADTVDGLHANDFTQIIDFGSSETDTKTAIGQLGKTAIYRCSKWTDYPSGCHDGQGTVIAINYNGAGTAGVNIMRVKQIFITAHYDAPLFHMRWVDDTKVGKWEEISTTPIKSTGLITSPTDQYGTIILPNGDTRRYLSIAAVGGYAEMFLFNNKYTVHIVNENYEKIINTPVTYIAFYIE